jgi:1,4-alpha-glucan branching enzyme
MKTKTKIGVVKKKPNAVRLEFHDDNARSVCVAGAFNDWNPKTIPMLTGGPGQWIKDLSLLPGSYEYQYVVDGKWINDPQAVKSTPNPYGGRNSVLVVESNNTKPETTSQPRALVRKTLARKGDHHDQ